MLGPRAIASRVKRRILRALGFPAATVSVPARRQWFEPEEIGAMTELYFDQCCGLEPGWDPYREAHMRLPSWFEQGLDPMGDAYAAQQEKLWRLMSGIDRPYEALVDEKEHSWGDIDPVRFPGYFVRRDSAAVQAASDHTLATGMILKHSGLRAGQWALEYGAGFGQTALAFARLGVHVDTVDISQTFCEYVRQQADFFQVPLSPFHGEFGSHPRPGQRYDLIWFYESFHHCVDFRRVVQKLDGLLAHGGKVVLAGEPIEEMQNAAVPYPWGVRLHSEVAVVMRKQHWFELGFSEPFLFRLFGSAGFVGRRVDCPPSLFGRLHIFERAGAAIG